MPHRRAVASLIVLAMTAFLFSTNETSVIGVISLVADGSYRIVVSLESVDFIDSTGLGVLISGLKRVRTHGGEFAVVCSEPRLMKVFEITGLDTVFNVVPTLDDALAIGS